MVECKQCILTSNDDPELVLDDNGICNHCHYYKKEYELLVLEGGPAKQKLTETIAAIKNYGKGKKADHNIVLHKDHSYAPAKLSEVSDDLS